MSRCRTNFHSNSEAMINKQINMELYASYVYMAMVSNNCQNKMADDDLQVIRECIELLIFSFFFM